MGIIKTKGIIIAENNMSDFDKMVTILTPSGKIGCAEKAKKYANGSNSVFMFWRIYAI